MLGGMSDSSRKPPLGRLARLGKVAELSVRSSTGLAVRALRKAVGAETGQADRSTLEHLTRVLGEMKGAAMKLGQALSMEADMLPPELRAIVARLQHEAPALPPEAIREVIESELGAPPEQLFAAFSREPLAAASLGQVHAARLEDGREVVVKVQYPGIAEAIESDFDNLAIFARAAGMATKLLDGRRYVDELRREIARETDYLLEAESARRFHQLLASETDLIVPEPILERSTPRVLCLTRVHGRTLRQFLDSQPEAQARWRVSDQLLRASYLPFFTGALLHADPHPGNYLVTDDGRLALLDFGCVKSFRPELVELTRTFMLNMTLDQPHDVLAGVRAWGFEVDTDEATARSLLEEIVALSVRPLRTADYDFARDTLVSDMRELGLRRVKDFLRIRPPADAVMLGRAVGGCTHNLRALGARGDFRGAFLRLLRGTAVA